MFFIIDLFLFLLLNFFYFILLIFNKIYLEIFYLFVFYFNIFYKIIIFIFYHSHITELSYYFFKYNPILYFSSELNPIRNIFVSYIFFIFQVLFIVVITIWTRAAGPRFRLDQLINITWKDMFIYLNFLLIFLVVLINIV